MNELERLELELESLAVFRGLLEEPLFQSLSRLLGARREPVRDQVRRFGEFARILYGEGENLSRLLWEKTVSDVNPYVLRRARGETVSPLMEACVRRELDVLQGLASLRSGTVRAALAYEGALPGWETEEIDFEGAYEERMKALPFRGYGVYAQSVMFTYEDGQIGPVKSPDPVRLSELWGYEKQRGRVIENTLALLEGRPAANVLLYGDAGTGKSSGVKAIVNEYGHRGLRLVEVRKGQILDLPALARRLGQVPLKFILFIDDLSFFQGNEEIGALKAILEGSASVRTPNVAVYATSNRRHLVKETFSERAGDDIHRRETIQEQVSLSERFGLSVCFPAPDREQYLAIVSRLAEQYGVLDAENLSLPAERYALERGGRSGRVARQFVESLKRR